jgi:hypothetical protein
VPNVADDLALRDDKPFAFVCQMECRKMPENVSN